MKKLSHQIYTFLQKNALSKSDVVLLLILCVGIFLRIWQLETKMIFFADAGRDMLAAVDIQKTGHIPLLGIPSSVPRFKQGPLFVWFIATIFAVWGSDPLMVGYAVSFMNCVALLVCYLLVKKYVNTTAALVSLLLLATSPLAVAHSRMPYHITPIISCFLLYLWTLQRLSQKKKFAVFISSLSWALLFQFELALFPMLFLVFYTMWKTKQWSKRNALQILAGLVIGLLPQIIFDLTNRFAQLGGFALWIVYRIGAFFLPGHSHSFSLSQLGSTWHLFITFFSRIFSLDHLWIGSVFFILLIISLIVIYRNAAKNFFLQHILIGLVLLLLAFVVHGAPSEAYFPPIVLLSTICLGCATSFMKMKVKIILSCALVALAFFNTQDILKNNFFTVPVQTDFQYGPPYEEQLKVMRFITAQSGNQSYELRSTDPGSQFETYLDNYRIIGTHLGRYKQVVKTTNQKLFFINESNSELLSYPSAKTTFFDDVDVIEIPKL